MQLDELTRRYLETHRHDCAATRFGPWQVAWYLALGAGLATALAWRWEIVFFLFGSLYLGIVLFRLAATGLSLVGRGEVKVTPAALASLATAELPVYTVLVPLYREANVADKIVTALRRLDYPPDRLDVKLLLEADDPETLGAVQRLQLPLGFAVVTVPLAEPRTKPRACNHGLAQARGEFCVIYDAEDRPDPDQLRKAVVAFGVVPPAVICLQAKLNFYNATQNLLTRWFTVEYSTYFDLFLPGLQVMGVPIPLGGTSNHFRTERLRELGGWDPFNVTEDCDLGLRLHQAGWRTRMLESTTWEEANPRLGNWLRQRSRWVKGYLQTHLVHWRQPFRTLARLGPWGALGFVMSVGGSALMMVLNVVFWLVAALYLGLLAHGVAQGYRPLEFILQGPEVKALPTALTLRGHEFRAWPLAYYGAEQDQFWSALSIVSCAVTGALVLANLLFVLMHVVACLRRRRLDLLPAALLMPAYWVLISLGAWKGLGQLFTRPNYWEKTTHGLGRDDALPPTGAEETERLNAER